MDEETKDFFKIFEKSKFKINPFTNKKINPNGEKANELRIYFSKVICSSLERHPGINPITWKLLSIPKYYEMREKYQCQNLIIKAYANFPENSDIDRGDCKKWLSNRTIDPITGKKIKENTKNYNKYLYQCLPESDNIACSMVTDQWLEYNDKRKYWQAYNPYTGRWIKESGQQYLKLRNDCTDFLKKENKIMSKAKFGKERENCLKYFENPKINPETGKEWGDCKDKSKIYISNQLNEFCPDQYRIFTLCFNQSIEYINAGEFDPGFILDKYLAGTVFSEYIALLFLMKKHKNDCSPLNANMADLNKYGFDLFSIRSTWKPIKYKKRTWWKLWKSRKQIQTRETLDKIYWPYNFKERLPDCNNDKSKRFIFIMLTYWFPSGGHAGSLLYDKKNKVLERFEPHGTWMYQYIDYSKFDQKILNKFKRLGIKVKKYVLPISYMNYSSLQDIEKKNLPRLKIDPGGYCAYWSLLYLDQRMSKPEKTRDEIMKYLKNKIDKAIENKKNPMELIVRQYASFFDKMYKDIYKKLSIMEVTYENIDDLVQNVIASYVVKYTL